MKPRTSHLPYLVLIGVLSVSMLAMVFGLNVEMTGVAGVKTGELPDRSGAWIGELVMYCSSKSCQSEFRGDECIGLETCAKCGEPVRSMSYDEWNMLPKDTTLFRKRYENPIGRSVMAAVVLSGKNRSSIHRPQVCLTGNGRDITHSLVIPVELKDGRTLKVMMLHLTYTGRHPNGQTYQVGAYYAYWLVGRSHRTPYHLVRMFWMAWERIWFSRSDRWAYVAVAGARDLNSDAHLEEAASFIRDFFPLIEAGPDSPPVAQDL